MIKLILSINSKVSQVWFASPSPISTKVKRFLRPAPCSQDVDPLASHRVRQIQSCKRSTAASCVSGECLVELIANSAVILVDEPQKEGWEWCKGMLLQEQTCS